jgi:hypothetical protein
MNDHKHCVQCDFVSGISEHTGRIKFHKHCQVEGCNRTYRHIHCECGWVNKAGAYQIHECSAVQRLLNIFGISF